jgi:hypothetical protein
MASGRSATQAAWASPMNAAVRPNAIVARASAWLTPAVESIAASPSLAIAALGMSGASVRDCRSRLLHVIGAEWECLDQPLD